MPIVGLIAGVITFLIAMSVSGVAYVITCVQVASSGITLDEITFLQNFRIVANIVIGFETAAITLYFVLKKVE